VNVVENMAFNNFIELSKCCLLFTLLVLNVNAADEGETSAAHLLVSKQIHNKYLVEHQDIIVKYNLYNIGSSAALDVQLRESSFPSTDFELVRGQLQLKFDRIAPGTNISHIVVVRPLKYGYFNFTSAEVSYLPLEEAEAVTGFSSEPGEGVIIPSADFDRRFSSHTMDWLAFALMTLPSLGIPFLLWFNSKSKYEAIGGKSSKKHS